MIVVPSRLIVGVGEHTCFTPLHDTEQHSQTKHRHIAYPSNRPSLHRHQARSPTTFVPPHRPLASYFTLYTPHMPSQYRLPLVIHTGLVYAAFYLLLKVGLGHYSVVFRALLSAFLTCPSIFSREWIFFILTLQDQIVRETYRILDEY